MAEVTHEKLGSRKEKKGSSYTCHYPHASDRTLPMGQGRWVRTQASGCGAKWGQLTHNQLTAFESEPVSPWSTGVHNPEPPLSLMKSFSPADYVWPKAALLPAVKPRRWLYWRFSVQNTSGTLDRIEPPLAIDTKFPELNTSLEHVLQYLPRPPWTSGWQLPRKWLRKSNSI